MLWLWWTLFVCTCTKAPSSGCPSSCVSNSSVPVTRTTSYSTSTVAWKGFVCLNLHVWTWLKHHSASWGCDRMCHWVIMYVQGEREGWCVCVCLHLFLPLLYKSRWIRLFCCMAENKLQQCLYFYHLKKSASFSGSRTSFIWPFTLQVLQGSCRQQL